MPHSIRRTILGVAAPMTLALAFAVSPVLGTDGVATLGSPPPEEDVPAADAAGTDPMDGLLDYAACMRENGVDMPDPQMQGGGFVMEFETSSEFTPVGGALEDIMGGEFAAADEACSHHLGAMTSNIDPAMEAELMEQLLAHAQCMREHGIDMPDPLISDGMISVGGASDPEEVEAFAFDPFSEEYIAAEEACREVLPFGDAIGLPEMGTP